MTTSCRTTGAFKQVIAQAGTTSPPGTSRVAFRCVINHVAVVPTPPLLVPELVAGPVDETAAVRHACLQVVDTLAQYSRRWLAVGTTEDPVGSGQSPDQEGDGTIRIGPHAVGTFRGFGVDMSVRLSTDAEGTPDPGMPLPALVAGWLRERVSVDEVSVRLVPVDATTEECKRIGARLAEEERASEEPVGLLVLGDGSRCHGPRAPGREDNRAPAFDERVHAVLGAADPAGLLDLDPRLARELGADGRAVWQVLAGLATATGADWRCGTNELMVPFGVAYHVAVWEAGPRRRSGA